jgi:preprotein translocase subunit SecA
LDLNSMFMSLIEELVYIHKNSSEGNFDSFREESLRVMGVDPSIEADQFETGHMNDVIQVYLDQVMDAYERKSENVKEVLLPICKQVYENEGHRYKRISIPFTDGRAEALHIAADLEKAMDSSGKSIMKDIEKTITLALLDDAWKEHLRSMDELRTTVQAAQFKQKDPLVEYKIEAFNFFERFMSEFNRDVVSYLMKGGLHFRSEEKTLEKAKEQKTDLSKVQTNKANADGGTDTQRSGRTAAEAAMQRKPIETVKRAAPKVKRNDPCPCGSGKKFKQCHGKL